MFSLASEINDKVVYGKYNRYEQELLQFTGDTNSSSDVEKDDECTLVARMRAAFLKLSDDELARQGEHIAQAFLHGFISQSREINGRKRVIFHYQAGQEPVAKAVFCALKNNGMEPVVQKARRVVPDQLDLKLERERVSLALGFSDEKAMRAYIEDAYGQFAEELSDVCGMIGLEQFGKKPTYGNEQYFEKLSLKDKEKVQCFYNLQKDVESHYFKPSTLSFCKVAYPNPSIEGSYDEILKAFFEINTEDSEPYELAQQNIIDVFDQCHLVHVIGKKPNQTDLVVALQNIVNPCTETKFLNCGGDLNIPYGEIFTTPMLEGTNGTWHIYQVNLKGKEFNDLKLVFKNGWLEKATCREGDEYIKKYLLNMWPSLTMGEFALGTNTKAYRIAEKYDLLPYLPILIMEKIGPHIAIGDPCFARGEDSPIYNLFDKKEMVCRENQHTAGRSNDDFEYFNLHIDITLPYVDVESIKGKKIDNTEVTIFEHGEFKVAGAEILHEGLKEI